MKFQAMTVLFSALLLSSCGNYSQTYGSGDDGSNVSSAVLDFETVRSAIFSARCVSCHQQYSRYSNVRNELVAIQAAVHSDRMPKIGAPLSQGLKRLLDAWITKGAPERADGSSSDTGEPLEAKWDSIYSNIIAPRCLVCHNPQGQAKFLDLSLRQAIFDTRNRIFDGGKKLLDIENPANSYLLEVIEDPVEPMPPIWSKIRRLNAEEIATLRKWIGLGLP